MITNNNNNFVLNFVVENTVSRREESEFSRNSSNNTPSLQRFSPNFNEPDVEIDFRMRRTTLGHYHH